MFEYLWTRDYNNPFDLENSPLPISGLDFFFDAHIPYILKLYILGMMGLILMAVSSTVSIIQMKSLK